MTEMTTSTRIASTREERPAWRKNHELIPLWKSILFSPYYLVQSFKIFDDESDGLKEQIISENTTLGVISALLFASLYSLIDWEDKDSIARFGNQEKLVTNLHSCFKLSAACFFAMSSIYCALVIALVSQLNSDYEAVIWSKRSGYAAHHGILMFMAAVPGLVGAFALEAIFIFTSDIAMYIFFILWLVIGGGIFMWYGLTILIRSVYQSKYEATELVPLGVTYGEADKLFSSYLKRSGNNFNSILTQEDWLQFLMYELYKAADHDIVQNRLSLYASRVAEAVFEDRLQKQIETEKKGSAL